MLEDAGISLDVPQDGFKTAVRLDGKPLGFLTTGSARAGFTNRVGQARFTYRLHQTAFKSCGCARLAITVRASTPRAGTRKKFSSGFRR